MWFCSFSNLPNILVFDRFSKVSFCMELIIVTLILRSGMLYKDWNTFKCYFYFIHSLLLKKKIMRSINKIMTYLITICHILILPILHGRQSSTEKAYKLVMLYQAASIHWDL